MFCEACRIGVMLCYFKVTFVIQQAIKYVDGITHPTNHFGVKRAVLVRNMRIQKVLYYRQVKKLSIRETADATGYSASQICRIQALYKEVTSD